MLLDAFLFAFLFAFSVVPYGVLALTDSSTSDSTISALPEAVETSHRAIPHHHSGTSHLADKIGIGLSGLCLLHCLLTPILILLIPSMSVGGHDMVHVALFAVLPFVALAAFVPGFKRHHDKRVFYWALPGIALIAIGAVVLDGQMLAETGSTILGSLLLIRAHLLNRELCVCCEHHH